MSPGPRAAGGGRAAATLPTAFLVATRWPGLCGAGHHLAAGGAREEGTLRLLRKFPLPLPPSCLLGGTPGWCEDSCWEWGGLRRRMELDPQPQTCSGWPGDRPMAPLPHCPCLHCGPGCGFLSSGLLVPGKRSPCPPGWGRLWHPMLAELVSSGCACFLAVATPQRSVVTIVSHPDPGRSCSRRRSVL